MNIYETHIAELHRAQEDFNAGVARVHEVYADAVQRSRERLLAALTAPVASGEREVEIDLTRLAADMEGGEEAPASDPAGGGAE